MLLLCHRVHADAFRVVACFAFSGSSSISPSLGVKQHTFLSFSLHALAISTFATPEYQSASFYMGYLLASHVVAVSGVGDVLVSLYSTP